MEPVKERKQVVFTLTFKNRLNVLEAPSKVTYRIDDVSSGTEITGNTDINNPSSAAVEVTVTAEENRILNPTRSYEERRFSFTWYKDSTEIGNDAFIYTITNLIKIPLPTP